MKKVLIVILVFGVSAGVVSSCDSSSGLSDLVGLASEYDDDDEEDDRRRTRRGRSRGRTNNDCEDSERCQIICDQNLEYTEEREACYYLSLSEIGRVEDVFDILKKPTSSNLGRISQKDFDLFVEIALDSWERVINGQYRQRRREEEDYGVAGPYTARQAEEVLDWMAGSAFVGNVLLDYDGVDILYNLFLRLGKNISNESTEASCSGNQLQMNSSTCIEFDSEEHISVVNGLAYGKSADTYSYLWQFALSDAGGSEFGAYDLAHQAAQKVCSDAEIVGESLSSKEDYKVCLSALYVCGDLNGEDLTGLSSFTLNREGSIGKYLLSSRYRARAEDGAITCADLVGFDNWSDYWEGTHSP